MTHIEFSEARIRNRGIPAKCTQDNQRGKKTENSTRRLRAHSPNPDRPALPTHKRSDEEKRKGKEGVLRERNIMTRKMKRRYISYGTVQ